MKMIGLVFFAVALNIDALMIAVLYGLRKIKIPWDSLLILSGVSMAAICLSMLLGRLIAQLMPQAFANYLGGFILICLGMQVIFECGQGKDANPSLTKVSSGNLDAGQLQLPLLKLPFALFKEPELVDLDHSGTILGWEAFLLGMTLALDAAGAGLAVALQGYSIWLTALFVGGGQLLFTRWGLYWGAKVSATSWGRAAAIIAGLILVLFGLLKVLCFSNI
jgi:putative sporulation protein YtaF